MQILLQKENLSKSLMFILLKFIVSSDPSQLRIIIIIIYQIVSHHRRNTDKQFKVKTN
jgi:hypothetical protein